MTAQERATRRPGERWRDTAVRLAEECAREHRLADGYLNQARAILSKLSETQRDLEAAAATVHRLTAERDAALTHPYGLPPGCARCGGKLDMPVCDGCTAAVAAKYDPEITRATVAAVLDAHQPSTKNYRGMTKLCACGHATPIGDMAARTAHLVDVVVQALHPYAPTEPASDLAREADAPSPVGPRVFGPDAEPPHDMVLVNRYGNPVAHTEGQGWCIVGSVWKPQPWSTFVAKFADCAPFVEVVSS